MIALMGMLLLLNGCHKEPIDGGTTDNSDPDAPKKIESKDLESFHACFYSANQFEEELTGFYDITLERNGDFFNLEETESFMVKEVVDKDVADGIYQIIAKYDLAIHNGIDKVTAGLPAEYEPTSLNAVFASKEKIYFRYNGDPEAEWTRELVEYVRDVFVKKGHDELKPKEKAISNYFISFNYDGVRYAYFTITDAEGDLKIARRVNEGDNEMDFAAEYPGPYYSEELQEIVSDCQLERFHTGSIADVDTTKLYSGDFYEVYIDYNDGTQIYGHSGNSNKLDQFKGIKDELFYRLDAFFPYSYKSLVGEGEIASIRQVIFDSGNLAGVAYLGRVEGPIGDGIINVIEGTDYEEWKFLTVISFDNYVETDGFDYFLILPLEDSFSLMVYNSANNEIYHSDGTPIILCCNADSGNAKISISDGSSPVIFNPIIKNGKLQPVAHVSDISIY